MTTIRVWMGSVAMFLGSAALLQAQAPARTCRVLYLGDRIGGNVPETLDLFDGKQTQKIDLPRMNLSKPYRLPGGALTLNLLAAPVAEGGKPPAGAPSATVAEGVESIYLLITQDTANKVVPLRMQVIDSSSGSFKAGQMMWYNLTPLDVFGKMGTQQVAIKGRAKTVTDAPASGHEDYLVNLSYRLKGDPKPYPICETRWTHDPTARSIIFLMAEQGTQAPRVISFRDNPEPKKDENKPQ